MDDLYSIETLEYLKHVSIKSRKRYGQYFTNKKIRRLLFDVIPKIDTPVVAELSVGTGEFLESFYEEFNNPQVYAYDIDPVLVNLCKTKFPNLIEIKWLNSLHLHKPDYFDYVIGNPPYYELKLSNRERKEYADIIHGRVNIYSLFVKKSIEVTKPNGYIALVIPTSINTGKYFSKLRDYIINTCEIEELITLGDKDFLDALQNTQILVLRKKANTGKYIFKKNNVSLFCKNYQNLLSLYTGKVSLKDAGYDVKTGSIVWNQKAKQLSNNDNDTLLIWSHNISSNGIVLSNKKPQYISNVTPLREKTIVAKRVTGCGKNAKLTAAIADMSNYVAENHVNVIFNKQNKGYEFDYILKELNSIDNLSIMQHIVGNTQISASELLNLFPITKKGDDHAICDG